ncbi:MAG: cell division protein SepF [Syntrophomonadaceae bacterium]|nr:cell division protein SepF [Syntrophomonadaceae bacterium]
MGLMDSFWTWLGVEREEVREELIDLPGNEETQRGHGNIVSIHSNKTFKVVVSEPVSFDEVQVLADHLKNRKQLILNFDNTPPEISQRIIDFISGTTYSLEGHSQALGKNIFIFTPSNVEIAKDHRSLIRKPGFTNPFVGEK